MGPAANQLILTNPIRNGSLRKLDKWGKGHYGASRGGRSHKGIDIIALYGQDVLSPIEGTVVRKSFPYANDPSFEGLLIEGKGIHKDFIVKIFYIKPLSNIVGKSVDPGDKIATAQSLLIKYPGITNHIHLEVKHNNMIKDPKQFLPNI